MKEQIGSELSVSYSSQSAYEGGDSEDGQQEDDYQQQEEYDEGEIDPDDPYQIN